jgi:hypothetical protein
MYPIDAELPQGRTRCMCNLLVLSGSCCSLLPVPGINTIPSSSAAASPLLQVKNPRKQFEHLLSAFKRCCCCCCDLLQTMPPWTVQSQQPAVSSAPAAAAP